MSATTQIELAPLSKLLSPHANPPHLSSFSTTIRRSQSNATSRDETAASTQNLVDPDFRLPKMRSLVVIFVGASLYQIAFFILVPSSAAYAEHLGGNATFSGLVIGIPVVFGGLALLPMSRMDKGTYRIPFFIQITSMVVGSIIYAVAYQANFLYLLLIGRMVQGIGFTSFMYTKRYCTDHRVVGLRRRTTLASYLVVTQGIGMSAGPFLGGVLFKVIGQDNEVWNGYTSVGWVMAVVWAVWGVVTYLLFEDVPSAAVSEVAEPPKSPTVAIDIPLPTPASETPLVQRNPAQADEAPAAPQNPSPEAEVLTMKTLTLQQWGTIACMCWFAITCFFTLGAFEANVPVFAEHTFNYSPYASGNFLALGGAVAFPLLFLNVFYARKVQDRVTLAIGSTLGLIGIVILLIQLGAAESGGKSITVPGFFMCWVLVALGFNLASTCTLSLLSKQLPPSWNGHLSLAIQYSNYVGRLSGAVWGGAGLAVGMYTYLGIQIMVVGIGASMYMWLWKDLKTKIG